MTTLVIGGAGYIGSHVVRLLLDKGEKVVVVDNLSTGIETRTTGAELVELDITAPDASEKIAFHLRASGADSVIHFAAHKQVGESVANPEMYWHDNIGGLANVLAGCANAEVRDVVFSSSAAVYGVPDVDLVTEDLTPQPINPYGATKYVGEWMLADAERAHGMRTVALRYFNVAGAGWPELADTAVMNLVPIVLDRLEQGKAPVVFGDDYDTPDGTCIRDYVHVLDLAHAHIAALDYLRGEERPHRVFNVGTGEGSSVLEVIDAIARAKGIEITPERGERRAGDPARLICSGDRIAQHLGWKSEHGLDDIVRSAVEARSGSITPDVEAYPEA
ncbi:MULTISPECIES: UDP-glucose 4-epimerase GalE [Brachybacterium]|uniref:UDP-glucose 4-epimerase GalE n=1 Tax=Brachybacterium TaxID=43668 RepID=UPI000BB85B69|nr:MULTISPECIES: UDP-glucose 4-epimerase GalE [Brachybacterium]PCC34806.1 UDP-glucose 4-epimerase GalE [Brachybacterium alimentarium]RCS60258.1 UDP-glucose 4-epimerase GalE [Brachybacterium sp. JB7]RCS69032.1 UDP-glucose 4-epimerase GalE [Brachybacterium alimentarium]RCS80550.1 UDP-glucose 4-epimerase GalE [Brachybacterium alimentarium]RCS82848.1 UDP-glucose 4-epimerase GalE [Brachybacterium alimentarium]